ncbi:hypothetical protein PISMIDRAFT_684902 [Pisolithus microcarpus 441]|uniref:Uncharacterized protein n=1 Tax=Pisolithus microcarpus 441 TaxID=765257 RepID=A0A0C9YUX4_9AGAM|nr:hypothetical protein PISMIDRAFT_684902 [Pisolithus microcarpus 441]
MSGVILSYPSSRDVILQPTSTDVPQRVAQCDHNSINNISKHLPLLCFPLTQGLEELDRH